MMVSTRSGKLTRSTRTNYNVEKVYSNGHCLPNGRSVHELVAHKNESIIGWKSKFLYSLIIGIPCYCAILLYSHFWSADLWCSVYSCICCLVIHILFIFIVVLMKNSFKNCFTFLLTTVFYLGVVCALLGQHYNYSTNPLLKYGAVVTVWNSQNACYLYSDVTKLYPIAYSDGSKSSHQQMVSCKHYSEVMDQNNLWYIFFPSQQSSKEYNWENDNSVVNGSLVKLVHVNSGRLLNSHKIVAPGSKVDQEVSGYIDFGIKHPVKSLWQVFYEANATIRFEHFSTGAILQGTGYNLSSTIDQNDMKELHNDSVVLASAVKKYSNEISLWKLTVVR